MDYVSSADTEEHEGRAVYSCKH